MSNTTFSKCHMTFALHVCEVSANVGPKFRREVLRRSQFSCDIHKCVVRISFVFADSSFFSQLCVSTSPELWQPSNILTAETIYVQYSWKLLRLILRLQRKFV